MINSSYNYVNSVKAFYKASCKEGLSPVYLCHTALLYILASKASPVTSITLFEFATAVGTAMM